MPGLLGNLVAGGMAGGASAELQMAAEQRKVDAEKQLMQQRADVETQMQQATEERHIKYAANLRTAMDQQLTPATEAILNAQGKTSLPPTPDASVAPAAAPAPGGSLTVTGATPGIPSAPNYAQDANGLLAGTPGVPSTPVAAKTNYAQATPTEMLTARALAMVKTGWVSNPDDVLKAAVTLNDTTQTSEARLEASRYVADQAILASAARGQNAASIHVDNPATNQHNTDVNLRGQAENLRKQLNDQYKIMTDPLSSPELKAQATAKKTALQKVLDGVMTQQATGQNPDSVVQSQPQKTTSWNDLP